MSKTIYLIDDETLFREGIKNILSIYFPFDIRSYSSATFKEIHPFPDYILFDPNLTHANSKDIYDFFAGTQTKIILLASELKAEDILTAADVGVSGYLLKNNDDTDSLVKAIRIILEGEMYYHYKAIPTLLNNRRKTHEVPMHTIPRTLTPREREVIDFIVNGYSNSEIALELTISEHTVKRHISTILKKCKVDSRLELIIQILA